MLVSGMLEAEMIMIFVVYVDDGKIKDDLGEFYHKPAANLSKQRAADKIRERLELRRERRQLEGRLANAVPLGADDEDALRWVQRSRDIEKQKREAAKRVRRHSLLGTF